MCQGYLCPLGGNSGDSAVPMAPAEVPSADASSRTAAPAKASERGTCMSAMIGEHSPVVGENKAPRGGPDAIAARAAVARAAVARAAVARAAVGRAAEG